MKTRDYCIGFLWLLLFILPGLIKSQSIEGCVTHGITGEPLEGAQLDCAGYFQLTGADGCYSFSNLPLGNLNLTCVYGGDLCPFDTLLNITTQGIVLDIQLFPCLDLIVDPLNIEVTLEPNAQSTEIITISNTGNISVEWEAELEIFPPGGSIDFLDVQFQYPVTGTDSHVGIGCDGTYFYITDPYSGVISKYALDGTFIETFTMITGLYDLAFDGVYFYGSAASTIIFQMDFSTQTYISSFTAPGNVRAFAYNLDEGVFYGYSWGGDIMVFDHTGANLGGAPVGPSGVNYSGFAYDNVTDEGPYLWGYGSVGTDLNVLVQIQLPTLQETGLIVNLDELLPEPLTNGAGGLFTHPEIVSGTWTLGGVVMDEWIWGLELTEIYQWVSIEPTSGVLEPGESEEMEVYFDASDLIPWTYEAIIQFNTLPNVGSPVIEIIMDIEGPPMPPYNLQALLNCVTVDLDWELSSLYYPPVTFNVYRDDEFIANTADLFYSDTTGYPEISYEYTVTSVYSIGETFPSQPIDVTIPLPDSLEPLNLDGMAFMPNENDVTLFWEQPAACLAPDFYIVYLDGELIAEGITDLEYVHTDGIPYGGIYTYNVTATYYFGESSYSNTFNIVIPGVEDKVQEELHLFPNPSADKLFIQSPVDLTQVELLNLQGLVVLSESSELKEIQLDVSMLKPSVYFLKLKSENKVILKKVIVK